MRVDPKDISAYNYLAMTYLASGRGGALDEIRGWLDQAGWRDDRAFYVVILGHFCLRRAHRDDDARRLLDQAVEKGDTSGWPYPVLRYLRREIEAKELLAAADDDFKMMLAQLYVGLDLALAGRAEAALPYLRWVKEHGDRSPVGYEIAVAEIDRIDRDKPATRP
ncbi:MAG TPA: hypothetical protein VGH33_00975 [Isosphaeraceae bacterium]